MMKATPPLGASTSPTRSTTPHRRRSRPLLRTRSGGCTEGDFGHSLFLIESGTAEALHEGTKIGDLGPGDVVGEVAVLASGRRIATVVATSPVQAIAFFKPDVWGLEKEAPDAARRLRAAMEKHVAQDQPPSAG